MPRKKSAQPPKLQKLDAEWKAFIKHAQKVDPSAAPWPDPSGVTLKPAKKKVGKAAANKASRNAISKKRPARRK